MSVFIEDFIVLSCEMFAGVDGSAMDYEVCHGCISQNFRLCTCLVS